jgi:hypothetical protein
MEMLIAGGMSYHSARRLTTGKISKVITECRSEIAKERNERARSAQEQEENRAEEREVLIKVSSEERVVERGQEVSDNRV